LDRANRQSVGERWKFYRLAFDELLAYAQHEFKLNIRGKDGQTLRETLKSVEKQLGRKPKGLENPVEFPEELGEEWGWFIELDAGRTYGHTGTNPISEIEIRYYFLNRSIRPQVWQIDLIKKLDRASLNADSK